MAKYNPMNVIFREIIKREIRGYLLMHIHRHAMVTLLTQFSQLSTFVLLL